MRKPDLPLLVWTILLSTLLSLIGGEIFGYQFSGWGWFIPLVAAMFVLPQNIVHARFPLFIWAPWTIILVLYFVFSDYTALQRTIQMLAPVIIGTAVSSLRITDDQINDFFYALKLLSVALVIIIGLKSNLLLTGVLPVTTGLAPEVMTNIVLSAFFATRYASGAGTDLFWWTGLMVNPVIALTRTAIAVNLLTLPFSFGPLKRSHRILIFAVICILGIFIFYSPRAQHKSFKEGSGEMSDVLSKDFNDSGRFAMWEVLRKKIDDKAFWGHGTGACENYVLRLTNGLSRYPHNDWLLFLFDYGRFGTTVFLLTILAAMLHAYRCGRRAGHNAGILFFTGSSTFISLALMMYTDNITIYASYFGNLQFTILGIAYAASGTDLLKDDKRTKIRIRW